FFDGDHSTRPERAAAARSGPDHGDYALGIPTRMVHGMDPVNSTTSSETLANSPNADRDQKLRWSGSEPRGRTSRFLPREALARQKNGSWGTLRTTYPRATRASSASARSGSCRC